MAWPKAFPNADHLKAADPQWRSIPGRPGIYTHDDNPAQEVEIILYQCPECGEERQTMHSVSPAFGIASQAARQEHSTCLSGHQMVPITLAESNLGIPTGRRRQTFD